MEWKEKFSEIERARIVEAGIRSLIGDDGKKALDYLTDVRKISKKIIKKFSFGYCPDFVEHQLRGRIITPFYDHHGSLTCISTRHLDKNAKRRFFHEAFSKSRFLYGLFYAKEKIRKINKTIIVEGEMDVALLHTFGFNMTVAACGSSLSLIQIGILSRYCSDIYLMPDGDEAGEKFINRCKQKYEKNRLKSYGINIIPVRLPRGFDPDEFLIKYGKNELISLLNKSKKKMKEEYGKL